MVVLVIQHVPDEGLGRLAPLLAEQGIEIEHVGPGQPIPARAIEHAHGVIVLGGPMGVHEADRHPRLSDEIALLRRAISMRVPVLGICLGSQLLAAALGAPVRASGELELGWHEVVRTPDAEHDALFAALPERFEALHWHGDVFALPVGATSLARSARTEHQAFSYGGFAWGLLFHLEAGPAEVHAMARAFPDDLSRAGTTESALERESARHDARAAALARVVLGAWIAKVRARR